MRPRAPRQAAAAAAAAAAAEDEEELRLLAAVTKYASRSPGPGFSDVILVLRGSVLAYNRPFCTFWSSKIDFIMPHAQKKKHCEELCFNFLFGLPFPQDVLG